MPRLCLPDYMVIRDTRDKEGHGWMFDPHPPDYRAPRCLGTLIDTLKTGDYSARGYEDILAIERKEDFSEVWGNYEERDRFEREMERMAGIRHAYVLIESHFTPEAFKLSPPQYRTGVPGKAMIAWLVALSVRYGVNVMCVGSCGRQIAQRIIEEVVRNERDRWVVRDVKRKSNGGAAGSTEG